MSSRAIRASLAGIAVLLLTAPSTHATTTIGSSLNATPNTFCGGTCTVMQTVLGGHVVKAPEAGVIIGWRLKHAGVVAGAQVRLRVLRPSLYGGYSGAGTGPVESVPSTAGTEYYPAHLPVLAGDRIAIVDLYGGVAALASADGTFARWSSTGPTDDGSVAWPDSTSQGEWTFNADIRQEADLALTLSAGPQPVWMPGVLFYTVRVTNTSPTVPSTDVVVTDHIPTDPKFVVSWSSQGSCSGTTTVKCALGTVAPDTTAQITIAFAPGSEGELHDSATVAGSTFDPNNGNDYASASATVADAFAGLVPEADSFSTYPKRKPNQFRVRANCTVVGDRCVGVATLRAPAKSKAFFLKQGIPAVFGRRSFALDQGNHRLTIPLVSWARRTLAKGGKVKAKLEIVATDRFGTTRTTGGIVTLKRPGG